MPEKHITYIRELERLDGWLHMAWCITCSWEAPVRDDIELAEEDRAGHLAGARQLGLFPADGKQIALGEAS